MEEISARRPIERQVGLWIGMGRRERAVNRALLILALGLALALLAVWVGAIIYAVHADFPESAAATDVCCPTPCGY
jgi:hypothetical protein